MKTIKILIISAFVLSSLACGSAAPPPPSEFAPDDAMRQALAAAKDDAEKQRKLAQDFGGQLYFADEFRQAEALNSGAGGLPLGSAEEYSAATAQYTAAAGAYRQISDKSLPRYFDEKSRAVKEAREKSVDAGAGQKGLWEDGGSQLTTADGDVSNGERLFGAKDYYGARDAYDTALSRYGVIETEALCYALRAEIVEYKLQSWDADSFARGEEGLGNAAAAYNQKDLSAAKSAADAALSSYQVVVEKGWEGLAALEAGKAKAWQDKAMDIKGHVAMKDEFEAAAAVYAQGEEAGATKEFKLAYNNFFQSETMFGSVYDLTLKQRQSADSLIKEADKKVSESAQKARDVQRQLTGGKR